MKISEFKEVASRYKVIFFDAYGVLRDYKGSVEGIEKTFAWLEDQGKRYFIITNDASRSPQALAEQYHRLGHENIKSSHVISSGMLSRKFLKSKVKSGQVVFVGPSSAAYFIESIGLEPVHISEVELEDLNGIKAVALLDDEGFDWQEDLNKVVNLIRFKNIPVLVANTDMGYPTSEGEVAIAIGGMAEMIEKLVGKVFIKFGKPDSLMFNFAFNHFAQHGVDAELHEVLMVGDTLTTDIIGGNKYGLDTALVLTGNTLKDDAEVLIRSTGIRPTYVLETAGITE